MSLLVVPVRAQDSYTQAINAGDALLASGRYDEAITKYSGAITLAGQDKTRKNNALSKKNRAIAERDKMDPSKTEVFLSNLGAVDTITVKANQPKKLVCKTSTPWCSIISFNGETLIYRVGANPDKSEREGSITLSKNGTSKVINILLKQQAREETRKVVVFTTKPDHAHLLLPSGDECAAPNERIFESGTYSVIVTKDGYKSSKVRFTVEDDNLQDTVYVHTDLSPQFARLRLKVVPEAGFSFDREELHVYLNRSPISLSPSVPLSYDADYRGFSMYQVYSDGTIPVSDSNLEISASVNGFERKDTLFRTLAGEEYDVCLKMKPLLGSLTLRDIGNAAGSEVYIDADTTFLGTIDAITRVPLKVGSHELFLRKQGYLSNVDTHFFIEQGKEKCIDVSMERYATYRFETTPDDAEVRVNDVVVDHTPSKPYVFRESTPNQSYQLEFNKEGFLPIRENLTPDYLGEEILVKNYSFKKQYPVHIETDRDNKELLFVSIKTGRKVSDKSDSTLVSRVSLPADVAIPLRKEPYYLEILRLGDGGGQKIAYRGSLRFRDEKKNKFYYPVWSQVNFHFLEATVPLLGRPAMSLGIDAPAEEPDIKAIAPKDYKLMGRASIANFGLFGGLSTSIVSASLFHGRGDIAIPDASGSSILRDTEKTGFLPAVSVFLVNDNFRIGGTLLNYINLNAVASYAWYPDFLKQWLGFSHIIGHDIFAGVEIGSCFPYFNFTFRAGWQMYRGMKANIYNAKYNPGSNESKNHYYTQDFNIPDMFTVGVIVSLGGYEAKGNSMLRVF